MQGFLLKCWATMEGEIAKGPELKDVIAICALVVSSVAIGISFWTARRQQRTASASLLTTLANTFDSAEMRAKRQKFAFRLLEIDDRKNLDLYEIGSILDFFEEISYLVKRGILDKGMVWSHFFWHIEGYYQAITEPTNLIVEIREKYKFPNLYSRLEWLYKELSELCAKENQIPYEPPDHAAVTIFLTNETQMIPKFQP